MALVALDIGPERIRHGNISYFITFTQDFKPVIAISVLPEMLPDRLPVCPIRQL